jgi:hypothetical protein
MIRNIASTGVQYYGEVVKTYSAGTNNQSYFNNFQHMRTLNDHSTAPILRAPTIQLDPIYQSNFSSSFYL